MAAKVPVALHSPSDVSVGSIASVGLSWHVGFTPDSGRVAARQRTDASGQSQTLRGGVAAVPASAIRAVKQRVQLGGHAAEQSGYR